MTESHYHHKQHNTSFLFCLPHNRQAHLSDLPFLCFQTSHLLEYFLQSTNSSTKYTLTRASLPIVKKEDDSVAGIIPQYPSEWIDCVCISISLLNVIPKRAGHGGKR